MSNKGETETLTMSDGGTLIINGSPSPENCQTFLKILLELERKVKGA